MGRNLSKVQRTESPRRTPVNVGLVEALKAAFPAPSNKEDGWKSFEELCEESGMRKDTLYDLLRKGHKEGKIESKRVLRPNIMGTLSMRPYYRMKE